MKIKTLTLALSLAMLSSTSHAGIKDMADDFWNETRSYSAQVQSSSGGSYSTPEQHAVYGPHLRVRIPQKSINLLSVTPPKINAGCNGIDAYMGGFSFISASQLKDMVRATMQAAPAYAFSVAMNTLCPTCNAAMQRIAKQAEEMAGKMKDSCTLAKTIVDASPIGEWARDKAKKTRSGLTPGSTSAENTDYFETISSTTNPEEGLSEEDKKKHQINIAWDALTKNKAAEWFTSVSGYGAVEDYELLMSLIGTQVAKIDLNNQIQSISFPATLKPKDFVEGTANKKVTVLNCPSAADINATCFDVETREDIINIPSLKDKIKAILDEMVDKMDKRGSASRLSPEATGFMRIDPMGTMNVLNSLKSGSSYKALDLSNKNSEILAEYIVFEMMIHVLSKIKETVLASQEGTKASRDKLLDDVNRRLDSYNNKLSDIKINMSNQMIKQAQMVSLLNAMTSK